MNLSSAFELPSQLAPKRKAISPATTTVELDQTNRNAMV
jgi:hypothetical protein